MSFLLEVKNISRNFGGLAALSEVSFGVNTEELVGIIGPNGAGKTTLFNVITGVFPPTAGQIIFHGEDITGLKHHQVACRGISRTFQMASTFGEFSALQNVLVGLHRRSSSLNPRQVLFSSSSIPESEIRTASDILEVVGLASQKDKLAENLSCGYQKLLAIGIACVTTPKLLLLDEPVTNLSPRMVEMVMELITKVRAAGTTVMLIEHNMRAIMDYCDRIIVVAYGKKIAEGTAEEIRENKEVIESYLGSME